MFHAPLNVWGALGILCGLEAAIWIASIGYLSYRINKDGQTANHPSIQMGYWIITMISKWALFYIGLVWFVACGLYGMLYGFTW